MDLHNLVTVEYNVTYNQFKLETVLKELQSRISQFDINIKNIDEQCQKMQKNQQSNSQQLEKLKLFTIDNFRDTVNQVSVIKNGLINYLGDQWLQEQESKQASSFSQLSNNFDSRLLAFNQQARNLSRKVTLMQEQLAANEVMIHEQKETVNNSISEQKKQINKIRESIREDINQKFIEFQRQLEDKNLKQNILKSQRQSAASIKLIQQQGENTKTQLMKTLKQLKKVPTNKQLQIHNSAEDNNNSQFFQKKGRKFKFDKRNFRTNSQDQACQYSDQQIGTVNQQTQAEQFKQNKSQNQSNANDLLISAKNMHALNQQSMQHAIGALREELKMMLDAEMLELKSGLESLDARYEKVDSSIVYLTTVGKQHHDLLGEIQSRIQDLKGEIDNSRTSLYEANERHNQVISRMVQQDEKSTKLEGDIANLTNEFNAFMMQSEETQSYMKFKEMHSSGPVNNNRVRSSLPGGITTPNLQNDNVLVQRLNNLTQKVSKLQEKFKNNNQQSQKTLPRINSSTHLNPKNSNLPSMDLLRKDMQKSNEELNKTNQRLQTLKRNLKQLQAAHSVIPKKIQKLEVDIRNVNEIQQDRLIDLIKQIINRVLTDPFNNNFTNTLKRQIHVKFLEIKYEYSSLWKDIEAKVADRAEAAQLLKLKQSVESQNLQIKSLVNKKADNDDFKKGIKYLDSKVKEVYEYLKLKETQENSAQGRKYYMGKK